MLVLDRSRLTVIGGCGFITAIAVLGLAWNGSQRSLSTDSIIQSRLAVDASAIFLSLLTDAETGQRGYVLTGRINYLEPYHKATQSPSKIYASLNNLQVNLGKDKIQLERWTQTKELTEKKLDELSQTVQLQQSGKTKEAIAIVNSGRGKFLMDLIRQQVAGIRDVEEQKIEHLTGQIATSQTIDQVLYVALIVSFSAALALIIEAACTERQTVKNSNAELKRLIEARQALTEMIVHKLGNPLAALVSTVDLIVGYYVTLIPESNFTTNRSPEKLTKLIKKYEVAASQLKRLIQEILHVSKVERHGFLYLPRTINPALVVEDIIAAEDDGSHRIHFEIVGESRNVEADPQLLTYIVGNLLSNAIKYSSAGSNVWLILRFTDTYIEFKVKDEGIGIPEKDRDRLFQSFERGSNTKNIEGNGLGLVTVKRAVEAHGGSLEFTSVPRNTEFVVTLPV